MESFEGIGMEEEKTFENCELEIVKELDPKKRLPGTDSGILAEKELEDSLKEPSSVFELIQELAWLTDVFVKGLIILRAQCQHVLAQIEKLDETKVHERMQLKLDLETDIDLKIDFSEAVQTRIKIADVYKIIYYKKHEFNKYEAELVPNLKTAWNKADHGFFKFLQENNLLALIDYDEKKAPDYIQKHKEELVGVGASQQVDGKKFDVNKMSSEAQSQWRLLTKGGHKRPKDQKLADFFMTYVKGFEPVIVEKMIPFLITDYRKRCGETIEEMPKFKSYGHIERHFEELTKTK